jgi:ribosomal protein S18 acetylase RimI-like enzyme
MNTFTIDRLELTDLVGMAQCAAIDAGAFPYASARFGLRATGERTWIARRDGRVDGFLAGHVARGALHVHGLAVAPPARGQGVGRALVRSAVDSSRDEGLGAVRLHVWVDNAAAIALYQSEGFAVVRRLRAFYPEGAFAGAPDAYDMLRRLVQ